MSSIKVAICIYKIFSKTFDAWDKMLTGLSFSLCKSSLFLKIGLTSASFTSSWKQLFSKEKSMILVIKKRCISTAHFSMTVGMSATGVALEASMFKVISRTKSSGTAWNENISLVLMVLLIL